MCASQRGRVREGVPPPSPSPSGSSITPSVGHGNAVVAARFRQLSSDRFAALKAQLFDLDAAGPRSIAEVRRENRRKEGHRDEDDEDGAGLEEDADLSFQPSTEPQALADLEATQKAVAVAVLWSKEGTTPGSRRFGISWSFHVPFLDPVLASLKHAAKVVLSSGEKSVRVPITLELRGTNHTPLIASVEAVDLSLSADVAVGASGTENEEYRSSLPVNRGMRWVGKTSYKDVTAAQCHAEVQLLRHRLQVRRVRHWSIQTINR